jgi:hypothetical protein
MRRPDDRTPIGERGSDTLLENGDTVIYGAGGLKGGAVACAVSGEE